jgi:hypothetical protein
MMPILAVLFIVLASALVKADQTTFATSATSGGAAFSFSPRLQPQASNLLMGQCFLVDETPVFSLVAIKPAVPWNDCLRRNLSGFIANYPGRNNTYLRHWRARYMERAFPSQHKILNAQIEKELARLTPAQRDKVWDDFNREWNEGHLTRSETSNDWMAEQETTGDD